MMKSKRDMELTKEVNLFQANLYRNLVKIFKAIKPAIEKFDGKVVNVKLENLMNEYLQDALNNDNLSCRVSESRVGNGKTLTVSDWNRHFSYEREVVHYGEVRKDRGTIYVDRCDWECDLVIIEKRLDAKATIENIDKEIVQLNQYADNLVESIEDVEEVQKEYERIKKEIQDFESRFHYSIRKGYNLKWY